MSEEKLIQISLQLPVSELAGISALLEQMRQLLSTGKETVSSPEAAERSSNFDEARFRELERSDPHSSSPVSGDSEAGEIPFGKFSTASETTVDIFPPQEAASRITAESPSDSTQQEALPVRYDLSDIAGAVSYQTPPFSPVDTSVSAARSEADILRYENTPVPAAKLTEGDHIDTYLPERHRDAEQLVTAGAAPLTAEAVSLAFRRDDRRYDNGFPLY